MIRIVYSGLPPSGAGCSSIISTPRTQQLIEEAPHLLRHITRLLPARESLAFLRDRYPSRNVENPSRLLAPPLGHMALVLGKCPPEFVLVPRDRHHVAFRGIGNDTRYEKAVGGSVGGYDLTHSEFGAFFSSPPRRHGIASHNLTLSIKGQSPQCALQFRVDYEIFLALYCGPRKRDSILRCNSTVPERGINGQTEVYKRAQSEGSIGSD